MVAVKNSQLAPIKVSTEKSHASISFNVLMDLSSILVGSVTLITSGRLKFLVVFNP